MNSVERLKLSYMGVKQHCDELERHGYVDTWRRPKPVGRPEMVYRLTPKSQIFFPSATNATTIEILQAANRLYGHAAGEKLLYSVFALKTENYMRKLRGKTVLELAGNAGKNPRPGRLHVRAFERRPGRNRGVSLADF